jgi:hypothetical protein
MRLSLGISLSTSFCTTATSAICAMLAFPAVIGAAIAYGPDGLVNDGPNPTNSDQLIRFDTDNPAAYTVVGSMGVGNVGFGGMDFDAAGNLWAYASYYKDTGGAVSGLYSVDRTTGAATPIGAAPREFLDDLAFNPADGQMYGIKTQNNETFLRRVSLVDGTLTEIGVFTGLPTRHNIAGIAFDSSGSVYLLENRNDQTQDPGATDHSQVFKGAGLSMSLLYDLDDSEQFGLAGEQGIAIDWSNGNTGYHAATGRGDFPAYYARLNSFQADGSGYATGPSFGSGPTVNGFILPAVQLGDLAVAPVPEPASIAAIALSVCVAIRRMRRRVP